MKTLAYVVFSALILVLVHTTPSSGNLFFLSGPATSGTVPPTSGSFDQLPVTPSAPNAASAAISPLSSAPLAVQMQPNHALPPTTAQTKLSLAPKSAAAILLEQLLGPQDVATPLQPTAADSDLSLIEPEVELRTLSSNRLLLVFLLPLLATPFVPSALAPLLVLLTAASIFFQQFGRLSSASRLLDFTMSALSLEPQFQPLDSNRNMNGFAGIWADIMSRLHLLTTPRGLSQLRQRTLDYFGASQPICQQRMVCEAAFSIASHMPTGFGNLVRSGTGFMFTRINSNDFFRAWLVGLTNDNCTVTYRDCPHSPFRRLLHLPQM